MPLDRSKRYAELGGTRPASICLVDDDEDLRDILYSFLREAGYFTEQFATGQEFLRLANPARHVCAVVDIRMPGMSGLELQQALNSRGLLIPLIMLTGFAEVDQAVQALKAGAVDFLQKPPCFDQLLESINRAVEANLDVRKRKADASWFLSRRTLLTNREYEVLDLLAEGKSIKDSAGQLNISPRTVEVHRGRIMRKLRVSNSRELVRMAALASNI